MDSGTALISAMQSQSFALPLMKLISTLGSLEFFLLFMPAIYWVFDPRLGFRVALALVIGHGLGEAMKVAFHSPRPYWVSDEIKALGNYHSFGFPSTHALDAACVWGTLAMAMRMWWAWASLIVLLIGISRVYLGVHFPRDVAAGWAIGVIVLLAVHYIEPAAGRWLWRQRAIDQVGASFLASISILALYILGMASLGEWDVPEVWRGNALSASGMAIDPLNPVEALMASGMIFGMLAGRVMLWHTGEFRAGGTPGRALARYALGIAGLVLIWYGISSLSPGQGPALVYGTAYLRSALAGLWVAGAAPTLFMRIGLAERRA